MVVPCSDRIIIHTHDHHALRILRGSFGELANHKVTSSLQDFRPKLAACAAMAWDEKNRDEWAKRYLEPLVLGLYGAMGYHRVSQGSFVNVSFCMGT